jgi:hypothetical protein
MTRLKDYMMEARSYKGNYPTKGPRNYAQRDLWQFYLALNPSKVSRIGSLKGRARTSTEKDTKTALFNAMFNNRFPFKVVAVRGGDYLPVSVGGGSATAEQLINEGYKKLIYYAKKEIEQHYGSAEFVGLNIDITQAVNTTNSKASIELHNLFTDLAKKIGKDYKMSSLTKLEAAIKTGLAGSATKGGVAPVTAKTYDLLLNFMVKTLFTAGAPTQNELVYLAQTPAANNLLKALLKQKRGDAYKELGNLMEHVVEDFLKNILSISNNIGTQTVFDAVKRVGSAKAETTFKGLNKNGNVSRNVTKTTPITMTPDVTMKYAATDKDINISLKMAQNPQKIIYKTAKGVDGEYWTKIAHWNKTLQTFAGFSVFNVGANRSFKLYQLLATSLASLAVGGTKEHRALIMVIFSAGRIYIKSLDVVLEDFAVRNKNKFTMNDIRIRNEDGYIHNARTLASSRAMGANGKPFSTIKPEYLAEEIYSKYSELRDLNLNFRLRT